jgi:parallel beta-helix repeat protein
VAPGTYTEQVVIPATGKDNLDLISVVPNAAKITAPATFGDPSEAIVHVNGAHGIDIRGFTITGSGTAAGPHEGVLVDNGGSADVTANHITAMRDNPLSSLQAGVGVQFGSGAGGTSGTGSILFNRIDDYQKGGIVVIGSGSSADVTGNIVRGAGTTTVIAQNGIQVSDGAIATVSSNAVTDNRFNGDFEGIGILVSNTAGVTVRFNTVAGNDEGIELLTATNSTVAYNSARKNTLNGIGVFDGSTGNKV